MNKKGLHLLLFCIGMNRKGLHLLLFGLLLRPVQTILAVGSEKLITCGTHDCPELMLPLENWKVATFNVTRRDSIKSSTILVDTFDLLSSVILKNNTAIKHKEFEVTVEIDRCGVKLKLINYNGTERGMYYCDCMMVSRAENQTGETTERVAGTLFSKDCMSEALDGTPSWTVAVAVGVSVFLAITGLLITLGVLYRRQRLSKNNTRSDDIELECRNITANPTQGDYSPKYDQARLVCPAVTTMPTPGDYSPKFGEGRLHYILIKKWREDIKRKEVNLKVRRDLENMAERLDSWCNTMDADC